MLKALLLTSSFITVPTVMLAPAVFAEGPRSGDHPVSRAPVISDDTAMASGVTAMPAPQRSRLKGGTNM